MPVSERGWIITPEELRSWILVENSDLLVVNKPGLVVCHPSKQGPWSSLISACREYLGVERLHMPSRLDRETSGVVVFAKNRETASRLQKAAQQRHVRKRYLAILSGELRSHTNVSQPIARDLTAEFASRHHVDEGGAPASTVFDPIAWGGGYTLAQVQPLTGRTHQIRVHAAWLGHAIAGDKLYGPDPSLMLEFTKSGFTPRLAAMLPLPRHALHASEIAFATGIETEIFTAPFPADLLQFCKEVMALDDALAAELHQARGAANPGRCRLLSRRP